MADNQDVSMCVVCGFPWNTCDLIRITWKTHDGPPPYKLVLATKPRHNDTLVCTDCVRQLKRLPFSEINDAKKVTQ